ncbi:MAG: DinB family protein, partial [Coriobacteriia bacterium]|nr:DinB family protein [Coriobacteriia bacterium]
GRAAERVDGVPHSIWELVLHLAVWARYAAYRFEGGVPRELDEANWPPVLDAGEISWAAARDDAFDACERAARALAALSDSVLDAVDTNTPMDAMGEPVTHRRVAFGLSQHVAYHAGQIALVKQLIAHGGAPA